MVKKHKNFNMDLHAVVYREGDFYLAHCLELDLIGEGYSETAATKTLTQLIQLQMNAALKTADLSSIFHPAPAQYWHLYAISKPRLKTLLKRPFNRLQPRTWMTC